MGPSSVPGLPRGPFPSLPTSTVEIGTLVETLRPSRQGPSRVVSPVSPSFDRGGTSKPAFPSRTVLSLVRLSQFPPEDHQDLTTPPPMLVQKVCGPPSHSTVLVNLLSRGHRVFRLAHASGTRSFVPGHTRSHHYALIGTLVTGIRELSRLISRVFTGSCYPTYLRDTI